jgi:hypothetical protein
MDLPRVGPGRAGRCRRGLGAKLISHVRLGGPAATHHDPQTGTAGASDDSAAADTKADTAVGERVEFAGGYHTRVSSAADQRGR